MRNHKTEAIVIKRRNYSEADRLVTIFTKDAGKLLVKASGVRRIKSKRSPHIELLNHTAVMLYRNQNMYLLTEAELLDDFSIIKEDLSKVGFAYHICELIDGLCPEGQDNEQVFFLLKHVLKRLSEEEDLPMIIHEFEVSLLTALGYWHREQGETRDLNTHVLIENILERRLKSKEIFSKLD